VNSNILSKTFNELRDLTRLQKIINSVLAVSILVLAFAISNKSTTVVMIPPHLQAQGELGPDHASEEIQVAWGLYIANMLGNVTPKTVGFLNSALAPSLSGRMYQPVLSSLEEQAESIRVEQLTVRFTPNGASFDRPRNRVVITGEHITQGVRDSAIREERTYEMAFIVKGYRVLLDDIKVYRGAYAPNRQAEG
jgi:conjugal transfer pilus assembly protein TraE